ncbi:Glycosyltransferase, GT2 family [Prevotellaceae bacterium MN60]|nr:Glycosyltransferase, GT2 family [Prevotellaceae bacterium MN60]
MNFLLVAVNYNSYDALMEYLDTIEMSLSQCEKDIHLKVVVADNSSIRREILSYKWKRFQLSFVQLDNWGYLGGASYVINNEPHIECYDYVAISNVDLRLDESFFSTLVETNIPNEVAWVAPSIFSLQEGRDKWTESRPSKKRFKALCFLFKYPILYRLYYMSLYRRKRKVLSNEMEKDIYAGHGAFILLTRSFFKHYPKIEYPVFLFCEENFFAELIREVSLKVRYVPSLKIWDSEHVSIGKMNVKRQCKYNYQAHKYIYDRFYNI